MWATLACAVACACESPSRPPYAAYAPLNWGNHVCALAKCSRCHSAKEAGCILADHVDLEGALALRECTAVEGGGGIAAKTVVHHQGTVSFSDCRASNGGGLHSCNFTQKGGTMTFQNCSQHRRKVKLAFLSALLGKSHGGGGLSVKNVLTQEGGLLNFSRCTSATNGGGLYMRQGHQIGGTMRFNWCQHQEHANHGGALFVDENVNLSGGQTASGAHTTLVDRIRAALAPRCSGYKILLGSGERWRHLCGRRLQQHRERLHPKRQFDQVWRRHVRGEGFGATRRRVEGGEGP